MQNNNINSNNEFDIFDVFFLILTDKWLLIKIIATFVLLSCGFYYFLPNVIFKTSGNISNINILLEENALFTNEEIIIKLNNRLASSYNYEKWSSNNKNLSAKLAQETATNLEILSKTQTITKIFDSLEDLEALTSYLSHSSALTSENIFYLIEKDRLAKLKEEIAKENLEKLEIENNIMKRSIELKAAQEELNYINSNIANEIRNTPGVTLHQLQLTNFIKVNKLIIENLMIAKEEYKILKTNIISDNKEIVRLGRISTSPFRSHMLVVFFGSIIISFFFGVVCLIFKNEYKKRKNYKF